MHALVIEPQIFASFMIEDALRDAGYTSVTLARSEEEALASAERDPPDLITAAVDLDPGSGLSAVERICSKHDASVLFITQRPQEVRERAPDAALVRKPFVAADLPPAIAEATGARHRRAGQGM
ncbi:MAG TPA: response regulator [Allosphingosinicella sp.]|jgi:DNA-binding response OmpR family regulator